MNINLGENMTTKVGMNKSDSVTMNQTESVWMMKNIFVGNNFMTNVVGKVVEFIFICIECFSTKIGILKDFGIIK